MRRRLSALALCGALGWLPAAMASAAATAEPVLAGAASVPFQLPAGVPLAGYSRRHGRASTGQHDLLGVSAVVLQQSGTEVVLVSADLLIIDEGLARAVRARLTAAGVPAAATLWLAATHTHSGPGAYGRRFAEKISMGHFDAAVFDQLVVAITQAVLEARAQLVPVRVGYRAVAVPGLVKNRVVEQGLVDEMLVVVGLFPQSSARPPLAVLASFAAHPTTLGAWNQQLSGDYPGVLMRAVEKRFPGTVSLFFAGAVGDQAPVKSGEGFERAAWIGEALAAQAITALEQMSPGAPQTLAGIEQVVPLPRARVRFGSRWALPGWFGRRLVDDDATLTAWRVGPVVGLGTPCDLESTLGAQLRAAAEQRGLQPLVASFVNDYIGYCVSPARYDRAEYEALMAFNGSGVGPLVVDQLTAWLQELR